MDDLFRRVRKPCSMPGCTRVVQTLAYVRAPHCQPCRRRLANLRRGRLLAQRAAQHRYRVALRRMEAR